MSSPESSTSRPRTTTTTPVTTTTTAPPSENLNDFRLSPGPQDDRIDDDDDELPPSSFRDDQPENKLRRKSRFRQRLRNYAYNNPLPINLFQWLYGLATLVYLILQVILYSYPYVHFSYHIALDSYYGVILVWNAFKPAVALILAYCCIEGRVTLFRGLLYTASLFAIMVGSAVFFLVLISDAASVANARATDPLHPANDPLFCCVWYDQSAYCAPRGPCLNINITNSTFDYLGGLDSSSTPIVTVGNASFINVTKDTLRVNGTFKFTMWLMVVILAVEGFVFISACILLRHLSTGESIFANMVFVYYTDRLKAKPKEAQCNLWHPDLQSTPYYSRTPDDLIPGDPNEPARIIGHRQRARNHRSHKYASGGDNSHVSYDYDVDDNGGDEDSMSMDSYQEDQTIRSSDDVMYNDILNRHSKTHEAAEVSSSSLGVRISKFICSVTGYFYDEKSNLCTRKNPWGTSWFSDFGCNQSIFHRVCRVIFNSFFLLIGGILHMCLSAIQWFKSWYIHPPRHTNTHRPRHRPRSTHSSYTNQLLPDPLHDNLKNNSGIAEDTHTSITHIMIDYPLTNRTFNNINNYPDSFNSHNDASILFTTSHQGQLEGSLNSYPY